MKFKKIIVCLLIFCLVLNISITPVEASFKIDDYILAQAIILTGITLTNGVVYTEVKNLIYDKISSSDKSILNNQIQNIKNGAVVWSMVAWLILKNAVGQLFSPGSNKIYDNEKIVSGNWEDYINIKFSSITTASGSYSCELSESGNSIRYFKNGIEYSNSPRSAFKTTSGIGILPSGPHIVLNYRSSSGSSTYSILESNIDQTEIIEGTILSYDFVEVIANENVNDPNHTWGSMYIPPDLTAEETGTFGKNIVGIPSDVLDGSISLDQAMDRDIYNKSASDVLNTPISNTNANSYSGIETGTIGETNTIVNNIGSSLSNVLSQILSILNSISSSLSTFFDLTIPINFQPLTQIGNSITEKFPFSLPWDYLRGLSSLTSVTGFDKKLNFSFFNTELEIDLSVLDVPIGFLRIGELIIFDISLIMATRKLLGGAV